MFRTIVYHYDFLHNFFMFVEASGQQPTLSTDISKPGADFIIFSEMITHFA